MGPLFRWAGSKKKLLPEIKKLIPDTFNTYHEPFCGSACLYFDLSPDKAYLSDINEELINAYNSIKSDPESVFETLEEFSINKYEYYRVRSIDTAVLSNHERAARFIYLNKLCFNGVYRTNMRGHFNVPMGKKTGRIPTRDELRQYSREMASAIFLRADFQEIKRQIKKGDLVYLDPPYSKPNAKFSGEYGPNSFVYDDVGRLVEFLKYIDKKGAYFILSYSDCAHLGELVASEWHVKSISVRRHVAGFSAHRGWAGEILATNFNKIET